MRLMCDPPEGWKYGFPKEVPYTYMDSDLRPWLIAVGYPPDLMKSYGEHFYVRYWEEPDETNLPSNPV